MQQRSATSDSRNALQKDTNARKENLRLRDENAQLKREVAHLKEQLKNSKSSAAAVDRDITLHRQALRGEPILAHQDELEQLRERCAQYAAAFDKLHSNMGEMKRTFASLQRGIDS
jgi:cell division septum initiation protein DivIVA